MRLGQFMLRKHFEAILKALVITARQPPAFRDWFWEVREIIEAWNANMIKQFTPVGSAAWMNPSLHGQTSTAAQDGCLCHENCGHLAMSITQCVAHCLAFSGRWNSLRGRVLHQKSYPNSTINGKLLDCCFMCWSPSLPGVMSSSCMTEFRQPLQVQSHLEMPGILVQLGNAPRN